jgi:hypothetical protein
VLVLNINPAATAAVFWRQADFGNGSFSFISDFSALNNLCWIPTRSLALQALQIYPEDTEVENTLHTVLPELRLLSTTPITTRAPIL